jgi:hypothetical protein
MSGPDHDQGRRRFLASSAAGLATTMGAADSCVVSPLSWPATAETSVVLHDPRILLPDDVQRRLFSNGARCLALEGDPVRLWRSDAGALLRKPTTTLMGVTGWADLLIFRGMAAETRRHLRYERLDLTTGTFIWLIA